MLSLSHVFEKINWKRIGKDVAKTSAFVGTGATLGALVGNELPNYTVKPKPELSPEENIERIENVKKVARPLLAGKGALLGIATNIGYDIYKSLKNKKNKIK